MRNEKVQEALLEVEIKQRSRIKKEYLKVIWIESKVDTEFKGLTRREFYYAMKLISLKQVGLGLKIEQLRNHQSKHRPGNPTGNIRGNRRGQFRGLRWGN